MNPHPDMPARRPPALFDCPHEPVPVNLPLYSHPDSPGFHICTKCYEEYLVPTPFAHLFQLAPQQTSTASALCHFNSSRTSNRGRRAHILLRQSLDSGTLQPLIQYMQKKANLQRCPGTTPTTGSQGIRWWTFASGEVSPGAYFTVCESCYEDTVLSTKWANQFIPMPIRHEPQAAWTCNMGIGFLSRLFLDNSQTGNWQAFFQGAVHRALRVLHCEKAKAVLSSSRRWYQPIRPIPDLIMCEACYLDWVGCSRFANHFREMPVSQGTKLTCTTHILSLQCTEEVIRTDFRFWNRLATTIMTTPRCDSSPLPANSPWWTISGGYDNFDICPACHAGFVGTLGLTTYFEPSPPSSNASEQKICDFSSLCARRNQFLTAYIHMVYTRDFAKFSSFIRTYSSVAPCPRRNVVSSGNWYMADDSFVCPECYVEVARDSALGSRLTERPVPQKTLCSLYSKRMRTLWAEACQQNDLTSFNQFARHRKQVYDATVPECQQIVAMQKEQLQMQRFYNTASTTYLAMGGAQSAVMGSNYLYNVNGRVFDSPFSAIGAQYGAAAVNASSQISSGNLKLRVGMLEKAWEEVE